MVRTGERYHAAPARRRGHDSEHRRCLRPEVEYAGTNATTFSFQAGAKDGKVEFATEI